MTDVKRDYYEVLGVATDADAETIRRAFSAATRDFPPDVAAQSPVVDDRFRELSEAYGILSNPELRLLYDRYGHPGPELAAIVDETVSEGPETIVQGEDVYQELELRPHEAANGGSRVVRFTAAETCRECHGLGIVGEPDPSCPVCGGTGRPLQVSGSVPVGPDAETCLLCSPEPCRACGGSGLIEAEREVRVQVPAGVEQGAQIRVPGEGNAAPRTGTTGELVLGVTVLAQPREPRFVRYAALLLLIAAVAALFFYLR